MSRAMKENDWNSMKIKVRCPFYVNHSFARTSTTPSISCEKLPSIEGASGLKIPFPGKDVRDSYMKKYCIGEFYKCPLCKYITRELEDKEDV